ncbi:ADL023Wp [Eremothecium gossypii ATCC 10895]|uniref:ADL023Wp n=2 Tax=Eremothecium gossypii TaxID=33169 RepID=Q75AE0_EREGS|nr:ADL023Wp [Eremothecium gossypii ATCC 10895]AAS51898.1 ADL023Wp [Eremothecium gossypii ATCC 10895]AEY96197.1 FADL023Wp [Eremothecium gossypii FDAG1]
MLCSKISIGTRQSTRHASYIVNGIKVRGLKNPNEDLKNPAGLHYNEVDPARHQAKFKQAFNLDKYGLQIPDDILLQCLTHKSFANSAKPYNEKLSLLGGQLLKWYASALTVQQPGAAGVQQKPVNGLNVANLGHEPYTLWTDSKVISEHMRTRDVDDLIFWNKRDSRATEKFNGLPKVRTTVLQALIGSSLTFNGEEKTAKFVLEELMDSNNANSLPSLALQMAELKA